MSRRPDFYGVRSESGMLRSIAATKPEEDTLLPGDTVQPLARMEPWSVTRIRLAKKCNAILRANNLKPHHKRARDMIHMFFVGALCAIDNEAQPWVTICLLSGRYDELLKED